MAKGTRAKTTTTTKNICVPYLPPNYTYNTLKVHTVLPSQWQFCTFISESAGWKVIKTWSIPKKETFRIDKEKEFKKHLKFLNKLPVFILQVSATQDDRKCQH